MPVKYCAKVEFCLLWCSASHIQDPAGSHIQDPAGNEEGWQVVVEIYIKYVMTGVNQQISLDYSSLQQKYPQLESCRFFQPSPKLL